MKKNFPDGFLFTQPLKILLVYSLSHWQYFEFYFSRLGAPGSVYRTGREVAFLVRKRSYKNSPSSEEFVWQYGK